MIIKNGKNISAIFKGSTPITKIYKGLNVIWEAFKKLVVSGIPPLTLTGAVGKPLIDYKIYGNSKKQAILPDEYQQLDYLEGDGTQYFSVDYIANEKTNSRGTFQITNTAKANFLFGSRVSAATLGCYGLNWGGGQPYKYYNTYYGNSNDGMTNTNIDDQKHTFEKIGNKLYIDGTLIHTRKDTDGTLTFTTPTNLAIFACNTNGTIGLWTYARIYYLQVSEGDEIKVELYPCRRKSDNILGMYDTVTGKFYVNEGAGEFIAGAELPTPDNPLELNNVGDKTYNLIDYSDVDKTANGVTFERKADGSIVCNGTATADTIVEVGWADLKNGKRYRGTGCPTGGSTSTYRMFFNYLGADLGNGSSATLMTADQKTQIRIFVYNGYKCENLTFYPMLTEVPDTNTKYPYKKAGYEIPVTIKSKNLYDFATKKIQKLPYNASGGTRYGFNMGVLEKGEYTISMSFYTYTLYIYLRFVKDGVWDTIYLTTGNINEKKLPLTFTADGETDYYVFLANSSVDTQAEAIERWAQIEWVQLEKGDVATDYEPYIEPITTSVYLDTQLNKQGNYIDNIEFANQKLTKSVGVKTFDGSENWELHKENTDNVVYRLDNVLTPMLNAPISATYMTHFSLTDIYSTSSFLTGTYRFGFDQDKLTITSSRLYVASDKTTLAEFKTWLAENKPTIFYPLETPIEESIVLPDIQTIKGTNIIDVETEIKPSNVEITYKGK